MTKKEVALIAHTLDASGKFRVYNDMLFFKSVRGWMPTTGNNEFQFYQDILKKIPKSKEMLDSDIKTIYKTLKAKADVQYMSNKTVIRTPTKSIDVRNGKITKADPNEISIGIAVEYDEKASPVKWWDDVLETSIPNEDSRKAYYEMLGLSMITDKRHEVSYWITGPAGTGKSTVILSVINGIHKSYNISSLEPSEWRTEAQSFNLIANKLINLSSDNSNNKRLETGVFKKLASGERVVANVKYLAPMAFENTALLISIGNDMPVITEKTGGPFRRMISIPMNVKVDKSKKNINIKEEIASNKDGVLDWIVKNAVESVIALYKRGYPTIPAESIEMIKRIKYDNSGVRGWLESDMVLTLIRLAKERGGHGIKWKNLTEAYNSWATRNGFSKSNSTTVRNEMKYIIDSGDLPPHLELYKRNNAKYLRTKEEE